jgi:hypothetical protein
LKHGESGGLEQDAGTDRAQGSGPFEEVNVVPHPSQERAGGGAGGATPDDTDAHGVLRHQVFMGIGTLS